MLTFEEAVLGIDNEPEFASISRQTSPGYPFNQEFHHGFQNKEWWLGRDLLYDLDREPCKQLRESVEIIISETKAGRRCRFVFMDCLKDERLPVAKVEAGKTRMFSSCPFDLLIVSRMYFGSFMLWYKKNRIHNGSAIGVNPYSEEWNHLGVKLSLFTLNKPAVGAGDYSRFDGSEKPDVHWGILNVINSWYDDGCDNQRIRRVLWLELVNSYHVCGDKVYAWSSSLPSGHPMTGIVNTMYNNIAFRYSWFIANNYDLCSLTEFDKYVYMCAMGDDNVFTVHESYREIFNEMVMPRYMAEIGLTYTAENKNEAKSPFRFLTEVDFLKRSFLKNKILQRYVAPLDLDVVLEIPYWTKDAVDPITSTLDNVDTTIAELSLHEKEVFDEYVPRISTAVHEEFDTHPANTSYVQNLKASVRKEYEF
nr:non-structural polyprotein [Flumine dicistrovirus 45]